MTLLFPRMYKTLCFFQFVIVTKGIMLSFILTPKHLKLPLFPQASSFFLHIIAYMFQLDMDFMHGGKKSVTSLYESENIYIKLKHSI